MKSEALRNIRTMRQLRTGLGVMRGQRVRTTNSLTKSKDEVEHLTSLTDRRLPQILEKERRRFATLEAGINKSRQRLLRAREKLAMTVNRNRALTELRHELQRTRYENDDPPDTKTVTPGRKPNQQIELRY